jgi:hypothetical protein
VEAQDTTTLAVEEPGVIEIHIIPRLLVVAVLQKVL